MRVESARARLGDEWDNYFKWTIVRNPWDRFVSLYSFRKRTDGYEFMVKQPPSFREWLLHHHHHTVTQVRWLTLDGEIPLDFIGRFENLEEDFAHVAEQIGYKRKLPHINVSKHDHYVEYYDSDTIDLVRTHCKDDIDTFGYRFGDEVIPLL